MIPYIEGDIIGVPQKSPTGQNPIIFLNTYTGAGVARNTWSKVDMKGLVPPDTKAIRLDGILIITHGTTAETADLVVHFRKPGETYEYNYIMQTIEASTLNGQRSNAGTWVALDDDLCFEYKWNTQSLGTYPAYSAYGLNLTLTAYLRGDVTEVQTLKTQVAELTASNKEMAQDILQLKNKTYNEDPRITQIVEFFKTFN